MANRFANGRKAFGFCDVCGFRFDLKKLKNLVVKTKQTQIKACPQCWTPDQPQLQLGMYPISDPQAIRDPRPDTNTWYQSGANGLQTDPTPGTGPFQDGFPGEGMLVIQWGWNPIGGAQGFVDPLTPNTLVGKGEVGQIAGFVNTPPIPGQDPYFGYVRLLLHMDGTSGSTTFVDNSPVNYPINVFGNAQVDTANFKFGTGSLLTDGNGDFLQVDTSVKGPILAQSSVPWTAELWVYSAIPASIRWNSASASTFTLGIYDGVTTADLLLAPITGANLAAVDYPINTAAWNFVAVVNDPTTAAMKLYINGAEVANQSVKQIATRRISGPSNQSFNGNIDDVRITVGVARYTSNFTPPTSAFPDF